MTAGMLHERRGTPECDPVEEVAVERAPIALGHRDLTGVGAGEHDLAPPAVALEERLAVVELVLHVDVTRTPRLGARLERGDSAGGEDEVVLH
jgi:hypothetical protein